MKEIQRAKYVGTGMGLAGCDTLLSPQCSPTQKPSEPYCLEASLLRHDWLNHWPLMMDSSSSLLSPLGRFRGVSCGIAGLNIPTF